MPNLTLPRTLLASILLSALSISSLSAAEIDNSSLESADFRPHVATYGLVYRLPEAVNATLNNNVTPLVEQTLREQKLSSELKTVNIPHITVVHIHSADPATPEKMLAALPKPPAPLMITLKTFSKTEAAKDAGRPWWIDLGVIKQGPGFEQMMSYNTAATAALAPLRDGPLPRVTGPVYAKMSDAGKALVKQVGVSGVNVIKDGQPLLAHNPHNTLVYSMTPLTAELNAGLDTLVAKLNQAQAAGIETTLNDVSIVQLEFAGNVIRELYRISLVDGKVSDLRSKQ